MEGKNTQISTLKSKFFQIPIEEYEEDMERESCKEKKKEILELFTTYNKLRSKEEFNEIKYDLHEACRAGDLELIKILLSERIEKSSEGLTFKIDSTNKTASLFKVNDDIEELIIPRTIEHNSIEYLITSIIGTRENIKTIKFSEDSSVKTFYKKAFFNSRIEEIYFPASLKELKEGWCYRTNNLKKIIISPLNGQFKFEDDKYLISKSDPNKSNNSNHDEFDNLLFVRRDIKEFSIPSNIKIISSYAFSRSNIESIFIPSKVTKICENAFSDCQNLTKFEIPTNSNLQTIESNAFSFSNIESIFIPSKVTKICKNAFSECENLRKVEIPTNSNLQKIESYAFSWSNIQTINIPSKVTKICEGAFSDCQNLTKFEIPTNSNLQTIESNTFYGSNIEEIYFPASLKELKEGWCHGTDDLKKIIISPLNGQFKFEDDKYLISKSDSNKSNNDEFDTLLFVRRDIKEFSIPSNIKIISSYAFSRSNIESIFISSKVTKICEGAFSYCQNLTKFEIPTNSNLLTIESNAFSRSNIETIFIPSKVTKIFEGAFSYCQNLRKVEIPTNSNLQTIESYAFSVSNIETIFIPSKVTKICEDSFSDCENLRKFEIPTNSNLQTIKPYAFSESNIESIFIPSKVTKICENTFSYCENLQIIEISEESKLESLSSTSEECERSIIMIPSSLRELINTNELI